MFSEQAECGHLADLLAHIGRQLDTFLAFRHPDALLNSAAWKLALGGALPDQGVGARQVMDEIGEHLLPNGSAIAKPGCTAFITTGATSLGIVAQAGSALAGAQRIGLTSFQYLEDISLRWLAELFGLPQEMQGIYSSGGSVANLIALGAARQQAFERQGWDVAELGLPSTNGRIYASEVCHRTIHRAAAVLGLGRQAVAVIDCDQAGRMRPDALARQIEQDLHQKRVPVAIVANAGATSTGVIDPIDQIADVAGKRGVWLHVDGAYGLPGILDPRVSRLYQGVERADSVVVDPHKWLGAPVGIGATFVRDGALLKRAFAQGASDYLEGSVTGQDSQHSMDSLGIAYSDFGVELSAPSRGAVVWALLREIGRNGMRDRVCRHNAMARLLADKVNAHPELELLQPPTLSICCFRYLAADHADLNQLNQHIHRTLVRNNVNIPSTAILNGKLAIRPCFLGARTDWQQVDDLFDEVINIGRRLSKKISTYDAPEH